MCIRDSWQGDQKIIAFLPFFIFEPGISEVGEFIATIIHSQAGGFIIRDLLIAYYNQRNAGAWSNKARTGNLKQFAEAVNYLTENKLLTLEDLQERLSSVSEEFEALSGSMKKKSARIKELQELIREGENYQRLKPVHTELNNIKFKKQREKFETSHDAELRLFYAARRILKEKLDGKPIALKAWKQEYAQLKTEYAELSPQHKPLREEVIRLRQVQNAVDRCV